MPSPSSPALNSDPDPEQLGRVLRKNILRLVLSLIAIGIFAGIIVTRWGAELDAITSYVFTHFGLTGIVAALFITDSLVSPLPPDSLLMLIAHSEYHQNWPRLIAGLGLVSCIAGYAGYGCGLLFSRTRWLDSMFKKVREQSRDRILKFGSWAIVLGALTPIPFSITCWSAGLMHLPFRYVWWPCLLRIPRYMLYYAAISYGPRLFM